MFLMSATPPASTHRDVPVPTGDKVVPVVEPVSLVQVQEWPTPPREESSSPREGRGTQSSSEPPQFCRGGGEPEPR